MSVTPPFPPRPLILAGWIYSDDIEKMERWAETVAWAKANGCSAIPDGISDSVFYLVEHPSADTVYRPWDFEAKTRPSTDDLARYLDRLMSQWTEIVGADVGYATQPSSFTGRKARRLVVYVNDKVRPPWGSWSHLSGLESDRRTFTAFRAAINKAITPHEVDHVDFVIAQALRPR